MCQLRKLLLRLQWLLTKLLLLQKRPKKQLLRLLPKQLPQLKKLLLMRLLRQQTLLQPLCQRLTRQLLMPPQLRA